MEKKLVARPGAHAVDVGDEVEVPYAGEEVVEVRVVGDVGHLALALEGLGLYALAVDVDLTGVKLEDAAAGLDGGGLAGPVGPQQTKKLP